MKSEFINCKNCVDDCRCKGKDITPICISFKPAKITNADRIRSMPDEELAGWINCRISICVPGKKPGRDCPIGMCEECWLEWLKQEVTENERH